MRSLNYKYAFFAGGEKKGREKRGRRKGKRKKMNSPRKSPYPSSGH